MHGLHIAHRRRSAATAALLAVAIGPALAGCGSSGSGSGSSDAAAVRGTFHRFEEALVNRNGAELCSTFDPVKLAVEMKREHVKGGCAAGMTKELKASATSQTKERALLKKIKVVKVAVHGDSATLTARMGSRTEQEKLIKRDGHWYLGG